MNILYISKLSGLLYSGPTYSVPNQIEAQNNYDNVFWYNISYDADNQFKSYEFYHDLKEYPSMKLSGLPKPFNAPDLIVIEELYVFAFSKIISDIVKSKIPYIIVPRSQMTAQAQSKKRLKKMIGNIIYFHRVICNAKAIQYLSEQEKNDSQQWNVSSFVIPNGIKKQSITKKTFSSKEIKAIMIGRLEPYQKGLDLLAKALIPIKDNVIKSSFILNIIGPVKDEFSIKELETIIKQNGLSEIVNIIKNPLYGEEKKEELLNSDLFIMTSRFEGMPMGLLEALSLGLPCLVTQGTNMKKEIEENDAGWAAENTVESIRNAILRMINERELLPQKGKNALMLSKKYSWDQIASKSHEMFNKMI